MLIKLDYTEYRPEKPVLVWDGQCGFCNYWITRWHRLTGDAVRYVPYQDVHAKIHDIPVAAFQEAVRMVAPDGKVFSAAEAAYRTLSYTKKWKFLYKYYQKSTFFRTVSERTYRFISDHRPLMYKVTTALFGKDPVKMEPYWIFYLVAVFLLLFILN